MVLERAFCHNTCMKILICKTMQNIKINKRIKNKFCWSHKSFSSEQVCLLLWTRHLLPLVFVQFIQDVMWSLNCYCSKSSIYVRVVLAGTHAHTCRCSRIWCLHTHATPCHAPLSSWSFIKTWLPPEQVRLRVRELKGRRDCFLN